MPTCSVGIRVYRSQGLSVNFASEAAAVGNGSALFFRWTPVMKTRTDRGLLSVRTSALRGLDFTMK